MDSALIFHDDVKYNVKFYLDNGAKPYVEYGNVPGGRINAAILTGFLVVGNDDNAGVWRVTEFMRMEVRRVR